MTKQELAKELDKLNPLYNFNILKGLTSYKNYKKSELLLILQAKSK